MDRVYLITIRHLLIADFALFLGSAAVQHEIRREHFGQQRALQESSEAAYSYESLLQGQGHG